NRRQNKQEKLEQTRARAKARKLEKKQARELKRQRKREKRLAELDRKYRDKLDSLTETLELDVNDEIGPTEVIDLDLDLGELERQGITKATLNQPGQAYMINRSVIDYRHWLDERDRNVIALFDYVLARACERFAIRAVGYVLMRNHLHLMVFDTEGRISEFCRYFFWLLAMLMNGCLRRRGTFGIDDGREAGVMADEAAMVRKAVYIAANPVVAGYCYHPKEWPAVSLPGDLDGDPIEITRPSAFFSERSRLPGSATLQFVSAPGMEDFADKVQAGLDIVLPT